MRRPLRAPVPVVAAGLLLLACCFLPAVRGEPTQAFRLEARVPAGTLALLTLEDVGRSDERFERTAIHGFFRDPEVAAFCAPIEAALTEMIREGAGPLAEVPPIVWDALAQLQGLSGQLAVALLDVDARRGMPSLVASLDFGAHLGDFVTFLGRLRAEFDPEGELLSAYERDGRTWWRVTAEGAPPLAATTQGTTFVLGTDEAVVQQALAPRTDSLAASADFAQTREKVGGEDLGLLVYANAPALWAKFGSGLDEEPRRIIEATGLLQVRSVAYGMSFKGDGFQDSLVIHAPRQAGSEGGLFDIAPGRPLRPVALARYAPATAFVFEEGSVADPAAILPAVRRMVARIEPDGVKEMDAQLAELGQALGVDLERELLGGLSGGYAFYAGMPETGGLYPEVAFMVQVKDPAAFESVFGRFAAGVAGLVSESGRVRCSGDRVLEYRGRRLHLFEMQRARGDDVVPFTPTWMLDGNWLLVTLVPYTMKEIVARADAAGGAPGGGLAAQEDVAALLRTMPAGTTHFSYLDLQSILNLLYDTAVPLLQTAVKPNVLGDDLPVPLDWALLPPARTVRQHFRSLAVFATSSRDGLSLSIQAPLPMGGLFVLAVAAAVPAFLMARGGPEFVEVRPVPFGPRMEGDDPAVELARVQAQDIARYVRAFLINNKRLPEDLQEVVDSGLARRIASDPWGTPFMLVPEEDGGNGFMILSAGPDQEFGTEDDVLVDG